MGMKSMYDLRDMLCKELEEITRKGELGAGDLDIAHKLTDTIKNIDKIEAMEDDGYSSRRDEYDMRGRGRRGTHYVRGHYSRDGGIDNMKRQLQEMLDNADDESIRRAIQRCMDTIEG
jgi:hypothetical protein